VTEYRTHEQHLADFFRSATSENARAVVNEIESLRRANAQARTALTLVQDHALPGIYGTMRGGGVDWRCDGCKATGPKFNTLPHTAACAWSLVANALDATERH
jgi:hypothetical protein